MKKLYRNIIVLEVLSENPIENETLQDVVTETTIGEYSGNYDFTTNNEEVYGKDAVMLCEKHGTDPEFFGMDNEGNEIEDENI